MADCIDREKLLDDLLAAAKHGGMGEIVAQTLMRYVKRQPAADVAPVVHGRWDDIPNTYMSVASKDGTYHGNATSCSVCHEVNPNAYKTNYCPNCGAKMDGGDPDGR